MVPDTDRLLAGTAVTVFVALLVTAALIPGVVADRTNEQPVRPGPVRVAEMTVQPGTVNGATAELRLTVSIDHEGNPTRNVTVRFRAIDADSGLLAAEETVTVGNLTDDREVPVSTALTVEREGGYVLETTVFRDGERIAESRRRVSGMDALTPEYARTAVGFTESQVLDPVSVTVQSAQNNRTTLGVATSLTNRGDETSGQLRIEVRVRQAESNLVADTATTTINGIRPGRTTEATTAVRVPTGYNYYLDIALFRDGVLVDAVRSVANLDPSERISANTTRQEVSFEVSDFEADTTAQGQSEETEAPGPRVSETQTPGFTIAIAVVALLVTALLARGQR